ncbi:hypothetical protein NGUA31_02902 [Salmonella enterica]|nr:hypothetical protein NGUA06_02838 [Salmonella enterica]GAR28749.1 hypothetical protein NGUA08_01598 [Salmonella enterica]GAR49436.1 hypothetical protein NGUA12_04273 [Salmonella enterica]GAR68267.1 hypothetical protein NGUA17_00431 [Salmonella enterica]GAR78900.1 hypothetical protein NGUA19_01898 [Salmonella enterica]
MALESGIAQLVEEFIAAGRPSSREQNIDDGGRATSPARHWQEKLKPASRLKILNSMP